MKFKKLLLYGLASACFLTALPSTSVHALTLEQLAADSTSIDVYFHDDGTNLTSLTEDDISATLDGSSVTVESFEQSEQRVNYMFLLDISRSVSDEYMTAAKQEILTIYENLNEEDLLSVITFGNEVHTVLNGTETLEEARAILDTVHCVDGYTHFYDAVDLMLERLEGTSDMRNIAVVVSDGINTGDANTSIESLHSRFSGSGISLYALAVDTADSSAIEGFREFIELSGGELFTFSPDTCPDAMQSLLSSVDKIWNVAIEVDPALATGEPQMLVIEVGEHGTIQREVVIEQREVDTTPPMITEWLVDMEKDTLALYFSEDMADLKNPEHYHITGPDQTKVPVTVLEHDTAYVLLSIEGLDNHPGWRADFVRLMDASPNRNLLKDISLLLTPEVSELIPTLEGEEPTTTPTPTPVITDEPEKPDTIDSLVQMAYDFLVQYGMFVGIGIGALLLILIICLIIKSAIRKRKADEEDADEEEQTGNEEEANLTGAKVVAASSIQFSEKEPQTKKEKKGKEKKAGKSRSRAPKTKRVWFRWFRKSSIDETNDTVTSNKNDHLPTYEEVSSGRVSMSKGSAMPIGSAPTRSTSQTTANSASAGSSEDGESSVHVNAQKHQRRGFFWWFRSSSKKTVIPEELEEESGIHVNSQRHGSHIPTRKGEKDASAKDKEQYEIEVDKVSEHRRSPKMKRVHRNWFLWRKKDIPIAEETPVQEETAIENETVADTDEIDDKTLRKYVKPKKNWFRRNLIPVAGEASSESPKEDDEAAATAEFEVSESESVDSASTESVENAVAEETPKDAPNKVGTSIKSGGFSLTGISTDTRPSFFNLSLRPETKLKNVTYKNPDKLQNNNKMNKQVKPEQNKKPHTNPSLGSQTRSKYNSSKSKNVHFTFTGDNQKKKN